MFSVEISLPYYPSMPPAPLRPFFAIAFWRYCINWAGGCPCHLSSAREQASNSAVACCPARHVMKWPNSTHFPWEEVRNWLVGCHDASCDCGEPGGDPHLSPHAACESRAWMFVSSGQGFYISCRRVMVPHSDDEEVTAGHDFGTGWALKASHAGLNLVSNGWVTQGHV